MVQGEKTHPKFIIEKYYIYILLYIQYYGNV